MNVLTVTLHPALDKVLVIQKLNPNGINRSRVASLYGGGKGNNVARALTRLGVPAIATGFQGGHIGEFSADMLALEGITTAFVFGKAETRTSTLVQEEETGNTFALYEPGQTNDEAEIALLLEKFCASLDGGDIPLCLLCGSGQTPLLAPVYATMIGLAKERGVRCLLDSSGEALRLGIDARPAMVKVNQEELAEYFHRRLDSQGEQVQAILDLQAQGIPWVALSRGKEGMIATDGEQVWEACLTMEQIVNVVGCGDSLLAGIAKSLLANEPLVECVRWGVACGTANTQVRGAGFIDLDLVQRLLPRVQLRRLTR
jgi:1-phosphofructokinase family hexose kinase